MYKNRKPKLFAPPDFKSGSVTIGKKPVKKVVKIKPKKKVEVKKCPKGKVLNPETNRCNKIKPEKVKKVVKKVVKKEVKPKKPNYTITGRKAKLNLKTKTIKITEENKLGEGKPVPLKTVKLKPKVNVSESSLYPAYVLTYMRDGDIPLYADLALTDFRNAGFTLMPIQADDRKLGSDYKGQELTQRIAGFTWLRDFGMKYIMDYLKKNPKVKGIFIIESDICLNKDYNFKKFLAEGDEVLKKPTWLAYKKITNMTVGNFMLWFPRDSIPELNRLFQLKKDKKGMLSDRFLSNQIKTGFINRVKKTRGTEIEHISGVKESEGAVGDKAIRREKRCRLNKDYERLKLKQTEAESKGAKKRIK